LLSAAYVDGQTRKLFFGLRPGPAGAIWVHRWCRRIVRSLAIGCTIDGPIPVAAERSLAVVANHLSYLDILICSAARPFIMVAKSEVRHWPLIGWITAQAGTIYVQRADVKGGRTQTHEQVNAAMAEAFRSGLPVLFFPEGTTTDGQQGVLPFRRGLFHSVIRGNVPIKAAAVVYSLDMADPGTSIARHVCFWGEMEFAPHLFRCLGVRGLQVHLRFGEEEIEGADRFALAREARENVLTLYSELMRSAAAATVQRDARASANRWRHPTEGIAALPVKKKAGLSAWNRHLS
jgi:1-acyl-sn-glycerol-3-phosphate acyltransferase